MVYERDIQFTPEQQEAFSQLVNDRLRALGWNRKDAGEHAGIGAEKISTLARTAPTGMPYGYFIKAMLALDIDLYEVSTLLGLDTEVKQLMEERPANYQNAVRNFAKEAKNPLDALVNTLPADKRDKARGLIEAILLHV